MFYIYSPQGRLFSGTMESLRKVKRTNGSPLISDDRDSEPSEKTEHVERYQVSEKAISEYHTMLKGSSVKEPVYHAYEIMSQPVVTLQTNDNWEKALDLFDRHSHHLLPVLNSRRALVATLSRSHFFSAALHRHGHHESLKDNKIFQLVGDDTEVISADPVTDIRRIATVMIDNELQAVPIVEEAQRLVGIVSRTDILKCVTTTPPLSLWS